MAFIKTVEGKTPHWGKVTINTHNFQRLQSPKKLTLAERIRLKLLKLAEDFEIVTIDDE